MTTGAEAQVFATPTEMLQHWQGHRRLSRRMIEAFPEDQLFSFSLGGMRSYGELALEMLSMGAPTIRGIVSGEWGYAPPTADSREGLLRLWDDSTEEIDRFWKQIPAERFHETVTLFGQYTGVMYDLLLYVIDNEVHHRGQGYVYLRALGVEPPPFHER